MPTASPSNLKLHLSIEQVLRHYGSEPDPHGRYRCILPERHEHGDLHHSVTTQNDRATCWSQKCFEQADIFTLIGLKEGLSRFVDQKRHAEGLAGINVLTNGHSARQITATYDYANETGQLLYQVVRFEPKDFRQRRPDGHGGWAWNLRDIEPILYKLSGVLAATSVLIVEGEKDVETAYRLGLPDGWAATCNPMGAGKWRDSYTAALYGKHAVIQPDADEPGETHGAQVALSLQGKAATVGWLTLPSGFKDLSLWAVDRTQADLHDLLDQATPWSEGEQPTMAPPTIEANLAGRVAYRRVSDIEAKPINWLWPGRFARGKVGMIAGNPGLGKSQITASMAAIVTMGGQWPVDRSPCTQGNVVILSAEDDPADTLRPRLEAAGADLNRCFVLDAVLDSSVADGGERQRSFNLQTDLGRLGAMLKEIGGATLIVIDPITAYLGGADSHKNAEIRALLAPLSDLAGQHRAAVVCVSHLNKSAGSEALLRVTGSLAFVAAARAAFVVAKDPDNDLRRLFLPLKNNIGNDKSGLAFAVQSARIHSPAGVIDTSCVIWEAEAVTISADSAMAQPLDQEERDDLDEAKEFLRGLLADGPVPSKQVRADAEGAGHAWRTVQRAQKALGIGAVKEGMKGGWIWRLPQSSQPEERQEAPKNATQRDWQPSHSSVGIGGLRGAETGQLEVEI